MPDINRIIETISDEETEHSSQTIEALKNFFQEIFNLWNVLNYIKVIKRNSNFTKLVLIWIKE
jgi:hypothetical protein